MYEENRRSALKAISWRAVATSTTMGLVYVFTREIELMAGVGLFDLILKMFFYFLHERGWNIVGYGKKLTGTCLSAIRSPPVRVSPSDLVSEVMRKMLEENIGAVVVQEDETLSGIITEKDILERVVLAGKDTSSTRAKEIMSSPITTIEHNKSIAEALKIMKKNSIRRLVVTREDKLVGLVTERRLLEYAGA
jgi:CBS domain-containing protein